MLTPCQRKCKVSLGMCITCNRALKEIGEWKDMADDERMQIMKDLKSRVVEKSTHSCPECSSPAYCGMEDGKSASLCWCMSVAVINTTNMAEQCLCKKCVIEGIL